MSHGTDRMLWAFRLSDLEEGQVETARDWLESVASETALLQKEGKTLHNPQMALTLGDDRKVSWMKTAKWKDIMSYVGILPGEINSS